MAFELSGKIADMSFDFVSGKPKLTLVLNERQSAEMLYDELHDCEKLSVKISKHREKRSLDANAYLWVLLDRLSEKLQTPKEDLYREAIKDIGGVSEFVCVKNEAVERLCDGWGRNGLGWQTDTFQSKLEGCTNVILYYGSSTYDKAQMSRLIDNIVQDCHAQGIDTMTPNQLAELKSRWGE